MKMTIEVRSVEGTDDLILRFVCPEVAVKRGDVARLAQVFDKLSVCLTEATFATEGVQILEVEA